MGNFPDQRRMMFEMSIRRLAQDGWGPFVYAWLEGARQDQPVKTDAVFANAEFATPFAVARPFVHAATNPILRATLVDRPLPPVDRPLPPLPPVKTDSILLAPYQEVNTGVVGPISVVRKVEGNLGIKNEDVVAIVNINVNFFITMI